MGEGRKGAAGRDQSSDQPQTRRRVTVPDAAAALGITVEAIRGRIKRGTIEHERDGVRVFVLVDADQPPTGHSQSSDRPSDQHPDAPTSELVEQMRDQVDDLRRRLDQSEEARRRADTIIMQLTQANAALSTRVPALEAAPDPPRGPESGAATSEGAELRPDMVRAQTGAQESEETEESSEAARRPLWLRWLYYR